MFSYRLPWNLFLSIIIFVNLPFLYLTFLFGFINYLLSLSFIGAKNYYQVMEDWGLFTTPSPSSSMKRSGLELIF